VSTQKRVGFIVVSHNVVEHERIVLTEIFSQMRFLPVFIENQCYNQRYVYKGFSPMFRHVKEGTPIPYYDIVVSKSREGFIQVTEVKEVSNYEGQYGSEIFNTPQSFENVFGQEEADEEDWKGNET